MAQQNGTRPIRLVDVSTSTGRPVELPSGKVVEVHVADGIAAALRNELLDGGDVGLLWEVAARLLPDASPMEVRELRGPHAWAVLAIGFGFADQVQAVLDEQMARRAPAGSGEEPVPGEIEGNGSAPRTTALEGSSPTIPSPTP